MTRFSPHLDQDMLWQALNSGEATVDDQQCAAEWLSALHEEHKELGKLADIGRRYRESFGRMREGGNSCSS